MNCERIQEELSRSIDEPRPLSSEARQHAAICDDCAGFRETALDVAAGYRRRFEGGVRRLRGLEPGRVPGRRKSTGLLPLAAAVLLVCASLERPKPTEAPGAPVAVAPQDGAPAPASPARFRLFDELVLPAEVETPLAYSRDLLPLRLDLEVVPSAAPDPEISLPRSLRF